MIYKNQQSLHPIKASNLEKICKNFSQKKDLFFVMLLYKNIGLFN